MHAYEKIKTEIAQNAELDATIKDIIKQLQSS